MMENSGGTGYPRALVFGEALWDLLPSGPVLGGASLNFAYRLGSLGVPTALVTQVGTDELGKRAIEQMKALGMEMRFVTQSRDLPTGTVPIELDELRNPNYIIVPDVAYDAVPWTEDLRQAAAASEILCFGTLAQRDERSRSTVRRMVDAFGGRTILTDINLRPKCYTEETVRWSLEHGTIAKLNDEEIVEIAGMYGLAGRTVVEVAAALCREAALSIVVVTLGAHGALAVTSEGEQVVVPGFSVELNDPCGAGDAFAGAFVASIEAGTRLEEALTRANALGALVASQPGATQTITEEEINHLVKDGARAVPPDPVLEFKR